MYKFLSIEQRQELLFELKAEHSRRYADRIRVILLLDEGKTYKDIAHFLFIDEGTIANYRKRYKTGGLEALVFDDYSTRRTNLNEFEEQQLNDDLEARIFLTTKEVIFHILEKYDVLFSISGCNNLLHRLGFSFKKPKGVPGKAKIEAQEDFIKKYNELKNENAKIYFGDATHPLHNTVLASGWIKKGKEKEVFTNSGRNRVNIYGAVSISNEVEVVTRSYETINSFSVCNFLNVLRAKNPGDEKLYFILDQGPSNTSLQVRDYAVMLNIEIVYLPAYSPNLNPIERLWKYFKKNVLYNNYYEKFKDFKTECSSFFRGIRKHERELESLITDNFTPVGT